MKITRAHSVYSLLINIKTMLTLKTVSHGMASVSIEFFNVKMQLPIGMVNSTQLNSTKPNQT